VSIDLDTTDDKVTAIPDTIVVVRHPSENTYLPKVENGNNETFAPSAEAEKKDENLKDVTPIDKPAKKVFRKRNGFFWFLGFRK
jgi:hypothetical protein